MSGPSPEGYTIAWASEDECGCIEQSETWIASLDDLIQTLVNQRLSPCDCLVFAGRPVFARWDKELNDRFVAAYQVANEESERREYERLKAKYEPRQMLEKGEVR